MRTAGAIWLRELRSFFFSPFAYIILAVWLLLSGLNYVLLAHFYATQTVLGGMDNPLTAFLGRTVLFYIMLLVFAPLLTMRLIAAERQSGTLELLLSSGVSNFAIIAGKYAAALCFWLTLWLPILVYAWITSQYGSVDLGALGATYLGIFGIGLYYMAAGLFASSVAPTPLIASLLTFCILGALFVLGVGEFVLEGTLRDISAYISAWSQMGQFSKGIIDSRYLVFNLSTAALLLGASLYALQFRGPR